MYVHTVTYPDDGLYLVGFARTTLSSFQFIDSGHNGSQAWEETRIVMESTRDRILGTVGIDAEKFPASI